MKKFLMLLLICLISFNLYCQTVYQVETKTGTQEVVIPDGYTEKDVLLIIASAYYDLDYDYEETLNEMENLNESLKDNLSKYQAEVDQLNETYEDLLLNYEALVKKYEKAVKPSLIKPQLNLKMGFSDKLSINQFGIDVGVLLFEKINIATYIDFSTGEKPLSVVGLRLGILF